MNQIVIEVVRTELKQQSISQAQLARMVRVRQPSLSRLLAGRSGKVPTSWQKIFTALNLELVVQRKGEG